MGLDRLGRNTKSAVRVLTLDELIPAYGSFVFCVLAPITGWTNELILLGFDNGRDNEYNKCCNTDDVEEFHCWIENVCWIEEMMSLLD